MYLGDLGNLGALPPNTFQQREAVPFPTIKHVASTGRESSSYLIEGYTSTGSGRGTITNVPGPQVHPYGPNMDAVAKVLRADETALPMIHGRPTLRWKDSDYIHYKVPRRAPTRMLFQRFPITLGEGRNPIPAIGHAAAAVFRGDPWAEGFDIYKKKIDNTADILGAVAMIAVGGALIAAATVAAQSGAIAASAASTGTTGTAATSGAAVATGSASTTGLTLSPATANLAAGGFGTGAAGGATAASGGALATGASLVKTASGAISAVKPLFDAGKQVYDAVQQINAAKDAAKQAEKEAALLEQMNREAEAALQWEFAQQQRARATALSLGQNPWLLLALGGVAIAAVVAAKRKRKR